jgi:hypothetical protein
MHSRRTKTSELVLGAALAALAGFAWARARGVPAAERVPLAVAPEPRVVEVEPEPVALPEREPAPVALLEAEPAPRHRRLSVGRSSAALGLVSLLVAGMAFSAGPQPRLESAPAASASTPLLPPIRVLTSANRHFYDPPAHIVRPPRAPILPAPRPSDRTVALARYLDGLGPTAVLSGLEAERSALSQRVLDDPRVHIYPGGRNDIASERVDPRVLALIEYLAEAHGEVSVSCLISGHSYYVHQTRKQKKLKLPQVISAHVYGRAVDISAVGGIPILGHQEPGGITERTIREILSLPDWLLPKQVISLLELGGPSFPLPDHADHIHVGY